MTQDHTTDVVIRGPQTADVVAEFATSEEVLADPWWTTDRITCLEMYLAGELKGPIAVACKKSRDTIGEWCNHPKFRSALVLVTEGGAIKVRAGLSMHLWEIMSRLVDYSMGRTTMSQDQARTALALLDRGGLSLAHVTMQPGGLNDPTASGIQGMGVAAAIHQFRQLIGDVRNVPTQPVPADTSQVSTKGGQSPSADDNPRRPEVRSFEETELPAVPPSRPVDDDA